MAVFNIENYLNSLPEDIEIIDVSERYLTYIPLLQRFYNLKCLYCQNNQITSLPELNHSLQELDCSYNNLTTLPKLNDSLQVLQCSHNKITSLPELNDYLEILYCSYNNLTSLPKLNNSLQILDCSYNQITSLPKLNHSLQVLDCYYNQLTSLPELNDSLQELYCSRNKLPYKLNINGNLNAKRKNEIKNAIQLLKRVKFTIMCLKYKKQFRSWLWIKVRLPMTQKKYHPNNLIELLKNVKDDDEDMLDYAINNW